MLSRLKRRVARRVEAEAGDEGFTLIELLVVLLIIGILLAIAIPTFLSVTKSANDTAAQSNLQTALTAAKTYYTQNNQTYSGIQQGFTAIDAGVGYLTGTTHSDGPHNISIATNAAGTAVGLAAWSTGTSTCWGIVDTTASLGVQGYTAFTGTAFVVEPNSGTNAIAEAACKGTLMIGSPAPNSPGSVSQTGFPKAP